MPRRYLIAPDKFKGSLSAPEAAAAMANPSSPSAASPTKPPVIDKSVVSPYRSISKSAAFIPFLPLPKPNFEGW